MSAADIPAILTVSIIGAPRSGDASDVARFVNYVQFRDIHADSRAAGDVDGLIAYVHHRDITSPRGKMFDADGPAGDEQRHRLVDTVTRSNAEILERDRVSTTTLRSAYSLIISPETARGLNLQRLTRSVMARLQEDAGGKLPPWIAGEHRNTAHPHVHVVLAARRETAPGQFRTLVITRERLAAMKGALYEEIELQRGAHRLLAGAALRAGEAESKSRLQTVDQPSPPQETPRAASETRRLDMLAWTGRPHQGRRLRFDAFFEIASITGRLSRYHRREAERLARQRRRWRQERDLEEQRRHRR